MSMEIKNVDLNNAIVRYPITKTKAFQMPLSDFQIELSRDCIENNVGEFGADCPWVFPSATSESGHLEEEKLIKSEPKLFKEHWTPHTLRHSWITNADQKVKISDAHQRALTNHKPKRAKNGDAHAGYIHPDLDDLRESQQHMSDYLLEQIKPKPGRGKKRGGTDNVIAFKK